MRGGFFIDMCDHQVTPSGILFDSNASGKRYLCVYYHRQGREGKSDWAVAEIAEHSIFCTSDVKTYIFAATGDLWGLQNFGNSIIGTREERIAKFKMPNNTNDPWHGYPVSVKTTGINRSEVTTQEIILAVKMLIDVGAISETLGKRIYRGKI